MAATKSLSFVLTYTWKLISAFFNVAKYVLFQSPPPVYWRRLGHKKAGLNNWQRISLGVISKGNNTEKQKKHDGVIAVTC
jgi:hypothetical protein